MSFHPVLDSTLFGSLDDAGKKAVYDLFGDYQSRKRLSLDNNVLFSHRKLIPMYFSFYKKKLDQTNPAIFPFLDQSQTDVLRQELLYSFYIFSAFYQLAAELSLDAAESRRQHLHECGLHIKRCASLLAALDQSHLMGIDISACCVAYLGSTNPLNLSQKWSGEGITVQIKDLRNEINSPRLYWVWASNWMQSWINLLSDDFLNKYQVQDVLSTIMPFTGCLSFSLYLINATVELLMLAKHTICFSWWSSSGEMALNCSAWERFKAHYDLRKYSILNDGIWGLGNLACFFWLTGSGVLGFYGNLATTALLLMDVVLMGFRFWEAYLAYQQMGMMINQLSLKTPADEIQKLCQFEWKYIFYALMKDLLYAITLVLAFAMLCCFFLSSTTLTFTSMVMLMAGGAALCFVASMINDMVAGVLDVYKSHELSYQAEQKIDHPTHGILVQLKGDLDVSLKNRLCIELKQYVDEANYYEDKAYYQTIKLIHELFFKLLVPPLMFSAFVFFPLELAGFLFVTGFIVAQGASRFFVGSEPEHPLLSDVNSFDKEQKIDTSTYVLKKNKHGFFSHQLRVDGFKVGASLEQGFLITSS